MRQPAAASPASGIPQSRTPAGLEGSAGLLRRQAPRGTSPLLLLVHGRAGGVIPEELLTFAAELEQARDAPVRLLALSDPSPLRLPQSDALAPPSTLVPLLLLPGGHVRRDLPVIAASLAAQGPLRRQPFLGSWPLWQRALAAEVASLVAAEAGSSPVPLLLHHPLEGPLAQRYLALLAGRCAAICRPAIFPASSAQPLEPPLVPGTPFLPLVLAANRLTDSLQAVHPDGRAQPLLLRPRLRRALQAALLAVP